MEKKEHWALRFIKWLGSALEDQAGAMSGKRIGFYILLYQFCEELDKVPFDIQRAATVALLAITLYGLTIPEWFSKIPMEKKPTINP